MPSMRWFLPLLLALTLVDGASGLAAEPPAVADLVVPTGDAPLRIRLRVEVAGEDVATRFQRLQAAHVRRLFAQLDRDGDGSLSASEAAHAPSPDILLPAAALAAESENVNVAFNFRAVDENGDGTATPAELLEFYRYFGGEPLHVRPASRRADQGPLHAQLLARLDGDGDGAVSLEELANAGKLATLDQNGDEALSPAELRGSAQTEMNIAQPGTPGGTRPRVDVRAPGPDPPDCEVLIEFAEDVPVPRMLARPQHDRLASREVSDALRIVFRTAACEIQAACGPLRVLERNRQALLLEFDGADEDGDGRVTADQRLPELLRQRFPMLDGDGDGAVSRGELDAYLRDLLRSESTMRRTQVRLAIHSAGSGLFGVLDENRDERLSLRELHTARSRCEELDKNSDGRLDAPELVTPVRIVIRRGDLSPPYGIGGEDGPPWFARMDRNRDGDVSAGEFPGPPAVFEQVDADGDGFIDLRESLQADAGFQRSGPVE